MKKTVSLLIAIVSSFVLLTSCGTDNLENSANTSETTAKEQNVSDNNESSASPNNKSWDFLLSEESESIVVGKLSPNHEFYQDAISLDPKCTEYINEISIYDKEIDDNFVIHLSLPADYDKSQKYPMIIITDGIWRLTDHIETRTLTKDGKIEPIIVASIGYPDGEPYADLRVRDLVDHADDYLHFIVDNVVPYLSEQYPVDSENMTLAGHSLGGSFGFYALFNNDTIGKNTFKNFYIGSPFLDTTTNGKDIATFEQEYFDRSNSLNCNAYVSVGKLEAKPFKDGITQFIYTIKNRNYEGLNIVYDIVADCDHHTVFKPSIKKTLLKFYGTNK